MGIEIGIDLGTTNSVVSYMENGSFEFVRFRNKDSLPSTLLYQNGKLVTGDKAKKKSAIFPESFIKSSKTYMGDSSKTWEVADRTFTPTDIACELLKEMRVNLEKVYTDGGDIEAVITVPAYFTSTQIDETKKAGEKAGFKVKQVITEPMAAAIAYGFEENINQKLYIVDIGGGTFDTCILEANGSTFNTLAIDGDNHLGGDDFDQHILDMFLKYIRREEGVNLVSFGKSDLDNEAEYRRAYQALTNKSEEIKIELSEFESVDVEISNLFNNFNLKMTITRAEFEKVAEISLEKIKRTIRKTLTDLSMDPSGIDKVVLVGGSAKIPAIRAYITELFGKEPYSDKPLDKLVAMGAAISATKDNSIQIYDIISHSLGVELVNKKFSPIILKNTKYPVSLKETYTTASHHQKSIDINVYEGEDTDDVNNNSFYGGFTLDDIENAPAGVPQIEVNFEFDSNRILKVTATDLNTNSTNTKNVELDKGSKKKVTVEQQPFDIVLLIDVSGSMSGYPLDKAKEACNMLVSTLVDLKVHRVALVEFESIANIMIGLGNDIEMLKYSIANLYCKGGTDIAAGLVESNNVLNTDKINNSELVILVTDGGSNEATAVRQAVIMKEKGIKLVSIGVGHGVNESLLNNVASEGGYYQIDSIDSLKEIFKTISSSLQTI